MLERDYMNVRELAHVTNAIDILCNIAPSNSSVMSEEEVVIIQHALVIWQNKLFKQINCEEEKTVKQDEIVWIVNDNAELGVQVNGTYYFLYKGDSIIYKDAKHDDGKQMYIRTVGKREFGESCHPINRDVYSEYGTVSLDDCDRWEEMPISEHLSAV